MDETDVFRSKSVERANALAELRFESARLCRQLHDLRSLVDAPTLRAFLYVPQRGGMVAGESPSTGDSALHETPPAAGSEEDS